jgi:YHS domain-containing protein
LESAKVMAKQSGRLVLVHFWTPTCGPCMALEQNVFNQPGVANAIETQFVPVKLNADENTATATWLGITRVPTDVIITPEGQIVSKTISAPTPAAYVAELTSAAGKYSMKSGQAYAKAAAGAPMPSQINSAYANLQFSPDPQAATAPSLAQQQVMAQPAIITNPGVAPSVPLTSNPAAAPITPITPGNPDPNQPHGKHHKAGLAANAIPAIPQVALAQPQVVNNPAAGPAAQLNAPSAAPAVAAPTFGATATPIAPISNPYTALTTSSPPGQPAAVGSVPPLVSPAQTTPMGMNNPGYGTGTLSAGIATAPAGSAPPTNAIPDPGKLPPGAPPLGFDGYCPVSMRNSWKWTAGDPRWGVVHRGRTYWFAGPEEQKQFWTDPDRYTPALSGMDAVLSVDHQQQVPGRREHSLDYDGLFYMFASEATLQQFTANPQRYSQSVRQAMGIPRGRLVR